MAAAWVLARAISHQTARIDPCAHARAPGFNMTGTKMNTTSTERFVSLVATYEIDPLDAAAFARIAAASVDQIAGKPGCLYYIASQDLKQGNVFHLAEGWATQEDLDAHLGSPDFLAMLDQAFTLRIVRREIYVSASAGRTLLG
jgi:quinol monooxygenase YgiN